MRVLTVLELLILLLVAARQLHTWVTPVSALSGSFIAVLTYEELSLPHVFFGAKASGLVVGGAVAMLVGCLIVDGGHRLPATAVASAELVVNPCRSRLLSVGLWCLNLLALWYLYKVYVLVRVDHTNYINGIFYREEFSSGIGGSRIFRATQLLMYVGALLFGLDVVARGWRRAAPIMFVIVVSAQSVVLSTKATFLITMSIMVATVGIAYLPRMRARHFTSLNTLAAVAVAVGLSLFVFVRVTTNRAGVNARVGATFAYAFAGAPASLSQVVDHRFNPQLSGGVITIGGLEEALGNLHRATGVFSTSVVLTPGVPQSAINVYTWYLPLVHDFGTVGGLALIAAVGMLSMPLARKARAGTLTVTGHAQFALVIVLLAWAPIVALTYYNFWWVLLVGSPLLPLLFRYRSSGSDDSDESVAVGTPVKRLSHHRSLGHIRNPSVTASRFNQSGQTGRAALKGAGDPDSRDGSYRCGRADGFR